MVPRSAESYQSYAETHKRDSACKSSAHSLLGCSGSHSRSLEEQQGTDVICTVCQLYYPFFCPYHWKSLLPLSTNASFPKSGFSIKQRFIIVLYCILSRYRGTKGIPSFQAPFVFLCLCLSAQACVKPLAPFLELSFLH